MTRSPAYATTVTDEPRRMPTPTPRTGSPETSTATQAPRTTRGELAVATRRAAAPTAVAARPEPAPPTPLAIFEETSGLIAGAVSGGLPLLLLSVPGLVLFVLFPLLVAAIPAAVATLLLAPPFLLVRFVRRRTHRRER